MQDALTHVVNAAEWLVGPIDRLVADVDHLALAGVTVEDTAQVLTRHGRVMGCFSRPAKALESCMFAAALLQSRSVGSA